ncbi:T9SS type A sorting domain-containing protein [Aurantibacillus circumpalustris]|uniref:T9SS type A sorting domain-containing protein n=1 Tax=Aurantibacillus circumpalustris TaxID=3036359 RepID=UPI00295BF783|nr:T9SS type A sorting domain-containing protein [Aurantibacillus circumpalustris]
MKNLKSNFCLALFFVTSLLQSQSVVLSTPSIACINQNLNATVSSTLTNVSAYQWMTLPQEPVQILNPQGSQALITYTSCGTHTVWVQAFDNSNVLIPGGGTTQIINVLCVNGPTVTVATVFNSVCAGFTTTLTAFGANTYTWFPGSVSQSSISVPAGTYTVIGTSSIGCQDQNTISIGTPPPLTIFVTQSNYTTCIQNNSPKYSKPVHLTASGAGTYVWFPYNPGQPIPPSSSVDVRPSTTTCYTVVGSTAICSATAVACVSVIPQFTLNVAPANPTVCLAESVFLSIQNIGVNATGPPSSFTYIWTEALNAPPISLSGYFTPTVNAFPQNSTTYTVEVQDAANCVSLPELVTVNVFGVCTSLEDLKEDSFFRLYPNPNEGKFTIQANTDLKLNLMNELGQLIRVINFSTANNYELNINNLAAGIYFVSGQKGGITIYRKIVVVK